MAFLFVLPLSDIYPLILSFDSNLYLKIIFHNISCFYFMTEWDGYCTWHVHKFFIFKNLHIIPAYIDSVPQTILPEAQL